MDDGGPAIDGVWTMEELYGRPGDPRLEPSLFFTPALGVRPSAALKRPVVHYPSPPGRGCHQRDGLIVMCGDVVSAGGLEPTRA